MRHLTRNLTLYAKQLEFRLHERPNDKKGPMNDV